jgi:hypothetical protein
VAEEFTLTTRIRPDVFNISLSAASESMPYEDVAHVVNELRQLFTYLNCDVSSIRQCLHAHLALSPMPSCLNGRPDSGERHIGLASLATNWMQPVHVNIECYSA